MDTVMPIVLAEPGQRRATVHHDGSSDLKDGILAGSTASPLDGGGHDQYEPEGLSELNLRVAELLRKRDGTVDLINRLEDTLGVRLCCAVGVTGNADHQLEQAFQVLVQQQGDLEEAQAKLQQLKDEQQQMAA